MADLGGGLLKLTTYGQFTTPSLSVLAGSTNLVPLVSDGKTLQLFGKAADLLAADKLQILGPSGSMTPFGRKQNEGCRLNEATLYAVPYPDGNSRMTLSLTMSDKYLADKKADGLPMPLVLIGSQVYGLKETPFRECDGENCGCKTESHEPGSDKKKDKGEQQQDSGKPGPLVCTYKFVAPTTDVRNAQSFLVKDLRWEDMSKRGTTNFFPLFSGLTATSSPPDKQKSEDEKKAATGKKKPDSQDKKADAPQKKKDDTDAKKLEAENRAAAAEERSSDTANSKTTLLVAGFDFDKFSAKKTDGKECEPSHQNPCLRVIVGGGADVKKKDDASNAITFTPVTRNIAELTLPRGVPDGGKVARFILNGEPTDKIGEYNVEWDLPLPKPDKPKGITADPATLRVSDTRSVVFEGDEIPNVAIKTLRFYGDTGSLKLDADPPDGKKLTVYVTTAVTKTPGHKELSVDILKPDGTTKKTLQLQLDVYK